MRVAWVTTRDRRRVRVIFYEREVGVGDSSEQVVRTVRARVDDPAAGPASRYVSGADAWVVVDVDAESSRPGFVMATLRAEAAAGAVPVSGAGVPAVVEGWDGLSGDGGEFSDDFADDFNN